MSKTIKTKAELALSTNQKKTMLYDVVLYTHANNSIGFGHASRCAKLYKVLKNKNLSVAFVGKFEGLSRELLTKLCDPVILSKAVGVIGVYDRMDDPEQPHIWSAEHMNKLSSSCKHVVFLANGTTDPELPSGVTCIGYKAGVPDTSSDDFNWGFEYAPFSRDDSYNEVRQDREQQKIFVALGGGATASSTMKVIKACKIYSSACNVDVLLSPVNNIDSEDLEFHHFENVVTHKNVSSLTHFFKTSGMVVASYGHLAYEALSYGAPTCVLGQKQFQTEFAKRLEERQLCVSAGNLEQMTAEQLAESIQNTMNRAADLSSKTTAIFDGGGINRIAELVYARYLSVK